VAVRASSGRVSGAIDLKEIFEKFIGVLRVRETVCRVRDFYPGEDGTGTPPVGGDYSSYREIPS
jgi:hypothetical protein